MANDPDRNEAAPSTVGRSPARGMGIGIAIAILLAVVLIVTFANRVTRSHSEPPSTSQPSNGQQQ